MKQSYTYNQLLDEVSRLAGTLVNLGVQKGDRVIVIHMPIILEAIVSMLACARIGAVHSTQYCGVWRICLLLLLFKVNTVPVCL